MRVLVADDDAALRAELSSFLELNGHEALSVEGLAPARAAFEGGRVDAALVDLYMGRESGMELLEARGRVPLIIVSGKGGVTEAVAAVRAGAYDFLEKPVDPDRLLGLLRNIERGLEAERRLDALRDDWLAEHAAFAPDSPFAGLVARAREAAATPLSVLVTGPSGSGKEIVARWIHRCSPRAAGPFVAVNCAAVQPELAESVFFGVRRGAYTGAEADRPGFFQAAAGGTLFLDELGEIPLAVQAKLLRAAESGEVQRLGSTALERVELRIVSATSRDLSAEAEVGRFRADLFWRLAQVILRVPPLSERRCDIAPLALFFLARLGGGALAEAPGLSAGALARMEEREWPGNVRELRACVERAAWLRGGGEIGVDDLEGPGTDRGPAAAAAAAVAAATAAAAEALAGRPIGPAAIPAGLGLREAKEAFERAYVEGSLAEAGGSVAKAAAALGILPNNLSRKLRELGISGPRGSTEG